MSAHHTRLSVLAALAALAALSLPVTGAQPPDAARGPAPTLVRPASGAKVPGADGFIQRWLILDPIRGDGQLTEGAVKVAVRHEHFPDQLTVVPRDGDTVAAGGTALTWHAVETIGYNVNLYHFAYALGKPTSNVLFWAVTVVNSPREQPGVRLAIGSNAASVWWINGREVIGIFNDRQTVIDDGVSRRITLHRGPNVIRAAIVNRGGATDFCARFLDEEGNPITGITVSLEADAIRPGQ
jgi:hypothetical protein